MESGFWHESRFLWRESQVLVLWHGSQRFCGMGAKFCFVGMEARFWFLAWKPGFWHKSRVLAWKPGFGVKAGFWFSKMQVSTKSRLPAEWYCKYRWNVASLLIRLRVSMECRFLADLGASIDWMSPPCFFLKNLVLWVSMECRLPTIFEIWGFFEPLFLFWNLGCGYQLKRCVSTIFFLDFASIDEVSLSCDFEVLEVSNGVRILPIFGFCVSID